MRRTARLYAPCLCVGLLAAAGATAGETPQQVYGEFNRFCIAEFGAEKEPLAYEHFGKELKMLDDGSWRHVSARSACIAWETNLPAKGWVEFGETTDYGRRTAEPERPFYLHIHTLRGLKPGTTYHYRPVSVDERGNRLASEGETFMTARADAAIAIPGAVSGPPFVLDKPGTYVLTQDVTADGTAFEIRSGDVTLDLGSHTVVYDNKPMGPIEGNAWTWLDRSAVGVRVAKRRLKNVRILNGTIRQGAGSDGGEAHGIGFSPIASYGGCTGEIAGVTVEYHGSQLCGMHLSYGPDYEVHHNVVVDKGTAVTNRHQGIQGIVGVPRIHHNLLKRVRQRGLTGKNGSEYAHNEIYVDSCCTNAFGIMYYATQGALCRGNRIFGRGYLAIGIGTVSKGVADIKVHRNFIHLQAHKPSTRWAEYGAQSGAYCVRVTWGGENIEYADNVFITKGRDGGMVRGVWFCPDKHITNVTFRRNVIKAIAQNDATDRRGAIVVCGKPQKDVAPGLFEDNRIISNFCHVLLGENYGAGNNARFVRNTFVRTGDLDRYRLVQCGFWHWPNAGSVFIDSAFEGDAGYDKARFIGTGERGFSVGWTLTVKTAPGAVVTITDKAGKQVFAAEADAKGIVRAELLQYTQQPDGRQTLTPHAVMAAKGGKTARATVTMDAPKAIDLPVE